MNWDEIPKLKEIYQRQVAYVAANPDAGAHMDCLACKFAFDITLQRQIQIINLSAPPVFG